MSGLAVTPARAARAAEAALRMVGVEDDDFEEVLAVAVEIACAQVCEPFPGVPMLLAKVLRALIAARGRLVNREAMALIIGSNGSVNNLISVHVCRLRKILGPQARDWVVTVWGEGFRWEGPDLDVVRAHLAQRVGACAQEGAGA